MIGAITGTLMLERTLRALPRISWLGSCKKITTPGIGLSRVKISANFIVNSEIFITGLPYMAIQSKNALDFSVFFFLCRKTEKLRNRIFPITPLVSTVSMP